MDILLATSAHPPFDTRIYHKIFKSLYKEEYRIKILVPNQIKLAKQDKNFISIEIRKGRFTRLINNYFLFKKCRELNPKLIIFFDPDFLPFMILYKLLFRSVVIYDNHEDYPNFIMANQKFPIIIRKFIKICYRIFEKLGLLLFDHIIYADPFTPKYYNIVNNNISVIHNYPIIKDFKKDNKEYDIIFPGSIDLCYKRILKIVAELEYNHDRKIKFLIIGRRVPTQIIKEITKFSESLINTELTLLMDKEYIDVQSYIEKSKIGIIPLAPIKKMENNIPTKMFEYIMHSIPQIGSHLQPISHYLNQTRSGFCVHENNFEKKYVIKINEILDNYDKYKEYADSDKKKLLFNWNWHLNEEPKLIKIINNFIGGKVRL